MTENPVNILSRRRIWSPPAPKDRVLEPEEIQALWKELTFRQRLKKQRTDNHGLVYQQVSTILALYLLTGARKNEILCLKQSNVDLDKKTMTFFDTKTSPERTIPLTDEIVALLEPFMTGSPDGWVFGNPQNKTGHVTEYKTTISFIVKHSKKIRPFSAHDLRRTFITYGSGVCPGDYVQLIVGHKLTTVTGRHYFKPNIDEIRPHMQTIVNRILSLAKTGKN